MVRDSFHLGALTTALLAVGCASNFRPLNSDPRVAPELASAEYQLTSASHNLGAAQVWLESEDDPELVRVGLRLRNEAALPISIDLGDTSLEVRTNDGRLFVVDELREIVGNDTIAPRQTGRVSLIYALPPGVERDDLNAFELVWAVESDDGVRVVQSTTFVPESYGESRRRRAMIR